MVVAHAVLRKGSEPSVLATVCRDLETTGNTKTVLNTDQEPAMVMAWAGLCAAVLINLFSMYDGGKPPR